MGGAFRLGNGNSYTCIGTGTSYKHNRNTFCNANAEDSKTYFASVRSGNRKILNDNRVNKKQLVNRAVFYYYFVYIQTF